MSLRAILIFTIILLNLFSLFSGSGLILVQAESPMTIVRTGSIDANATYEPSQVSTNASAQPGCYFMAPVVWHWDGPLSIGVSIPDSPAWAHRVIYRALQHWNIEQTLFEQKYRIEGDRYTFFESDSSSASVQISYGMISNDFLGLATPLNSTSGEVNAVNIGINTNLVQVTDNRTSELKLYRIALHELGHVLGLGDIIYPEGDIMNGWGKVLLNLTQRVDISTLDLYVINLLSTVSGNLVFPWFICKPSNIPYSTPVG